MKLLLENWREYLSEEQQCETVIAYHGSPKKFDKFSMEYADPESHSGLGLFFSTDPMPFGRKWKYVYKAREVN